MENNIRASFSIFLISILSFTISSAQSSNFNHKNARWKELSFDFQDNFKDSLALWPERILLQIANKQTNVNNPIFFKAYLSLENQSAKHSKSGVLKVELLDEDGTVLKRQFHRIANGMAHGQIDLPRKIAAGSYMVKAYTRWSQNYGADFAAWESVQVGDLVNKEKSANQVSGISIIPEGGTFLSGHKNRIIVKIPTNQTGKAFEKGRILNGNKEEVAEVSFYSSGLGTVIFKPVQEEEYYLELENGTLFNVPKPETEGYLLHVNNLDRSNARIRITASNKVLEQQVILIGTSGGIKYFEKKLNFSHGNTLDVELSKLNFPQGIFTLKLIDNLGSELAKRPIWITQKKLQIDIDPIETGKGVDLKSYKIKVTDRNNKPVKSQLAISVNRCPSDSEKNLNENSNEHTSLFTFYDITDTDENKVSYYRKASFLKDIDLLSSKREMEALSLDEGLTNDVKFPFQKGLEIVGHAYDLNNNLLSNTKVQIFAKSEHEVWMGEAQTNAQGIVRLEDIQIEGEATLVARTKGEDVKSRLVKIEPFNMVKKKNVLVPNVMNDKEYKNDVQTIDFKLFNNDASEKTIELEEVEVVEQSVERRKLTPSIYGINVPPNRINYQDFEKPKSLLQLLAELPGVVVSGSGTLNPSVRIVSASGPVLWVLDGFPLSQGTGGAKMDTGFGNRNKPQNALTDIMALANAQDIERIELLTGADAAIFGSRGSGGVFVIYTRTGNELEYIPRKDGELVFEGYMPTLDFNEYKDGLTSRKESQMNLLYWNPNLETDKNGEAIIRLSVPYDSPAVKIEASAISVDGKIGASSNVY